MGKVAGRCKTAYRIRAPVRACVRAAESLAAQTEPLERLRERAWEIRGVGDAIADIIALGPAIQKIT